MSSNSFFAMISRMKYINRWGLMRNTRNENIAEHSLEVAIIAHAMAVIGNTQFGKNYNAERAGMLAVFHDCSEIITGDLPTPVKYHSDEIRQAYQEVENLAENRLVAMLPQSMTEEYKELLTYSGEGDKELRPLVKAADKISAVIKCIEEEKSGNEEFKKAQETLMETIKNMKVPEANVFIEEFLPKYKLSLDELE